MDRGKIVAIITGVISIGLAIAYLKSEMAYLA